MNKPVALPDRAGTGIEGLDMILKGGLPKKRIHLVFGSPGTGKTTLGIQFLLEGVRGGERVLYITLLQTRAELNDTLNSHGWTLDGVEVLELPETIEQTSAGDQTLFRTADLQLSEVTQKILEVIDQHKPGRMVLDSISELSVLVESTYQLRWQLLKIKGKLDQLNCTTLFIAGDVGERELTSLQTIVTGAVGLEVKSPAYGSCRRRLEVVKMRGMDYLGGYHDYRIRTGGLEVFPRIQLAGVSSQRQWTVVASGVRELDSLLGDGLEQGTSCLVTGTSGAGKSVFCTLYVEAAAERGERSAIFCFDEGRETFLRRAEGLGLAILRYVEQGLVELRQVDVGTLSPGQLSEQIRRAVEHRQARIVVIDSLSGYLNAMPEDRLLINQLHELVSYLSAAGVLTLLVEAESFVKGPASPEINASYLADTIVLIRHFEAFGSVRRCISVLKKRHGKHESIIREVEIGPGGLQVGLPLTEFSGVLSGSPSYHGPVEKLMGKQTRKRARKSGKERL